MKKRGIITHNHCCIDCEGVMNSMISLGAFTMCPICFELEYPDGTFDTEAAEYLRRLEKHKKNLASI